MGTEESLRVHALVDSLGAGGAELLLAEFAAAAPSAGIDLSVGYLQDLGGSPGAERLREAGVEPTLVGIPGHLGPAAWRLVREHLASVGPDVLHTHLPASDLAGGVVARTLKIPVVSTIHAMVWGADSDGSLRDRARERLVGLARRRCAARVIAVSDGARRTYLDVGWDTPARVVTVHNGIARPARPGEGAAVREELGLGADDLVVGMLSALRPEKAHDIAFAAIAALAERFPRLRLLVAGDGPDRERVEQGAAPLGERVVMAGYRADVMPVLDAMDVLIHPSRADAFPTTLLEAMAAGVPIVATRIGGIPEIVDDGVSGVLIDPPPTAGALGEALAPLLEDRDLRLSLGGAGQERFARDFGAEAWARRVREVYDSVLDGR